MCRIIAVANVKGGVGKTTTAVNLSASLAELGRKVLAVDLDPQSSLTVSLGFDPDQVTHTILDMLDKDGQTVRSSILTTPEDWEIIPSNPDLRGLERELESEAQRIYAVGAVLQKVRKYYDYILVDCPANAGILTGAALAAADEVVIPLTPDFLGFRVLGFLIRIIKEMQKDINPKLRITGIFLTMYDSRTRHAREILTALHNTYASEVPFFSALIHHTVRLKEAPSAGKSIIRYAPNSQAAQAYRIIAGEIDQGVQGEPPVYLEAMLEGPAQVAAETSAHLDHAAYCRAAEMEPNSIEAWVGRAETAANSDEEIRCLAKAITLDPDNQEFRTRLEKRLEVQVLNNPSPDLTDLMKLGQYLSAEGLGRYAETIYRRVTDLNPKREEAWLERARLAESPVDRGAFIQRCLDINPNNPAALEAAVPARRGLKEEAFHLVDRGTTLIRSGSMAEAHLSFKRAIQLDPSNDGAWLGCAHTSENLPAKLSFVKQALEINPRNAEARDLLLNITSFMTAPEKDHTSLIPSAQRLVPAGVLGLAILISFFLITAFTLH
jgi:chromosome partitioning protein